MKFFDYYKTEQKLENDDKKGPVILSVTKKVLARKDQKMEIEEKEPEVEQKVEKKVVEKPRILKNPFRILNQ